MTGGQRDLGNFSATLGNKLGVIYDVHSSQYTSSPNTNLTLATSFTALPDIADTNRGSGLVTAWIPEKGMVVVGGNSATIRVWDLASERCSRIFTTGLDTCTTALASKAISSVGYITIYIPLICVSSFVCFNLEFLQFSVQFSRFEYPD